MKITPHDPDNVAEIKQLFTKVFADSEGENEGVTIGNLAFDIITSTASGDVFCFVATDNKKIIGSIMFSRLLFDNDINAFILSPVAVHTKHQRKGVGQKLINAGLTILKKEGVELVFTYGDPDYYCKVGFECVAEETIKAPLKLTYPKGWLCQSLAGKRIEPIAGNSYCVSALNKPAYW